MEGSLTLHIFNALPEAKVSQVTTPGIGNGIPAEAVMHNCHVALKEGFEYSKESQSPFYLRCVWAL